MKLQLRPYKALRIALVSACGSILISSAALPASAVEASYQYDAAGRLVTAIEDGTQFTYQYDAAGNLLARTVPEPSSTALAFAALAALGRLRRSRARRLRGLARG